MLTSPYPAARRISCIARNNSPYRTEFLIGIEDVYNFRSTRHYCVSTLHANGLPYAYIMERGGWATTDVLNYVYRHTLSSQSAALTDKALNHFESVTKFVTK